MKEREVNCETYNENKGISTDEKAVVLFDKNLVEKAIENFLQETIAPALQPYADVLIQQCKEAIEKIVVQNVIERADAEVQIENRKRILERTKQIFKDEVNNNGSHKFPISKMSKADAVERAKLTQEWMDGIGGIKKEEEELSAIWEGWFIEMNKDSKITDQKRALEAMKSLSVDEARLMLDIQKRKEIQFKTFLFNKSYSIENEKSQYLINLLLRKELITKINSTDLFLKTITPLLMSFVLMVVTIFTISSTVLRGSFIAEIINSPLTIIGLIIAVFVFSAPKLLTKIYQLTWLGEKIVSYARKKSE